MAPLGPLRTTVEIRRQFWIDVGTTQYATGGSRKKETKPRDRDEISGEEGERRSII